MSDVLAPTLEALARLVSFDTTSSKSNLALIEWVEAHLSARGVASHRVANAEGTKVSLHALIGPATEGGVVLSGHTDVVPVEGQAWDSDPWTLVERDGKLYARGAADMKSFLALALAHVDNALAAPLKRPLLLAFSYDEEVGCLGAPGLIAELLKRAPTPSAVLVGEPTGMKVVSAHKGVRTFLVEVTGREAHSSLPDAGISAIVEALKLMNLVAELGQGSQVGDAMFSPPGPTLTIGRIEGGVATNILARQCRFLFDLRAADIADADRIEARVREAAASLDADLKRRAPEAGVSVTRRSLTPPLLVARDSVAETLARALTGDNEVRGVSYAAEAGLYQGAGIPAIICGPGSIEQAHQPNEWIARTQIEEGGAFMHHLIDRLCA